MIPGSGKVELTGNLGNVMKESARAAFTYIRSRAVQLGIEANFYKEKDIHVHFPEGAVPKDGPLRRGDHHHRHGLCPHRDPRKGDVAMTGEVTLRGRVLPIGGLREKSMAALRNGIHTVIIPKDNEPDLEEIDQTVRSALQFIPVDHVDQVLANALRGGPLAQPGPGGGPGPRGEPGDWVHPRHHPPGLKNLGRERKGHETKHTERGVYPLRGELADCPRDSLPQIALPAGPT